MKHSVFLWVSVLSLISTGAAFAAFAAFAAVVPPPADVAQMRTLFESRFQSGYESSRCGENINGLLDASRKAGIDARVARVIGITNKGFTTFGMVNAEQARGGFHARTGKQFPPEEKNWYHHVILEMDCLVFDFDFTNQPTVLPLAQYFERMFLDEDRDRDRFYVGRDRKLEEYEIETYRAADYFVTRGNPKVEETMRLKHLLKQCPL